MGEIGLEIDKKGDWCLLGSPYGAAPIPRSTVGPLPHGLSPVPKLGIPMYPLVGLIFTTSVLDSHPALTNTARMRELICCASAVSLLAARLKYALFRAKERRQKLTHRREDRPSVRYPVPRTCGQDGRAHFCSADVITLQPRPQKRATDRLYMKKEIPWSMIDRSVRTTPA